MLQDRDAQITEYTAIINAQQPATENREGLINSLRQQLGDKDRDLQVKINRASRLSLGQVYCPQG